MIRRAMTAACFALLITPVATEADPKQASGIAEAIVGPWRLAEWVVTDGSGNTSYPYGRSPEGLIVYTADGHMAVQLMNPDASRSEQEPTTLGEIVSGYIAYYGTYTIDEESNTHWLTGSLLPSWIGSDQVREYELIDGNRLRLTAKIPDDDTLGAAGAGGSNVLTWVRVE